MKRFWNWTDLPQNLNPNSSNSDSDSELLPIGWSEKSVSNYWGVFLGSDGPDSCLVDTWYPTQSGWKER